MTVLLDSFTFSPRPDVVVEKNDVILNPGGSFVFTLAGDDRISSIYTTDTPTLSLPTLSGDSRETVFGIYNQESIDTSSGKDIILGDVKYTGESLVPTVYGITQAFNGANNGFTSATIATGSGNDKVSGLASSSNSSSILGIGNFFSSEINTGAGRDEVKGEARGTATSIIGGIDQGSSQDSTATDSLIVTGKGDDKVIGVGDGQATSIYGIEQSVGNNQLITGNGDDEVRGSGSGSGRRSLTGITQGFGNNQIITDIGNDIVIGEADGNASVVLIGIAQSGNGNNQIVTDIGADKVIGEANGNLEVVSGELEGATPGIVGISQQGGSQKISTGISDDEVIGKASGTAISDDGSLIPIVGIAKLNSTIDTGIGADKVIGEASGTAGQMAGIVQQGSEDLITTGISDDEVIGTATGTASVMAGIAQQPGTSGSEIVTDKGDDKVMGTASNDVGGFTAGILGDFDINTGSGNDEVIASAQISGTRVDGFAADPFTGGTVTVNTGSDDDLVKGFGQGNFDGGEGNDIYDLSEYSQSEFTIEIGTGTNNEVNFTHTDLLGESTASTQGFEVFRFADGELSFSDLA